MTNFFKTVLILIFTLVPLTAQNKNYNIRNINNGYSIEFRDPVINSNSLFNETYYIALPKNSKVNFSIIKVEREEIILTDTEKKLIIKEVENSQTSGDYIPSNDIEVISYANIRDNYCAALKVNYSRYNWKTERLSVIKNIVINLSYTGGMFNKVGSNISKGQFDVDLEKLIINYDDAAKFGASSTIYPDTTGSWINYNNEYIKLSIINDGIYRIHYNDLLNYGISPSSINPQKLKIYLKGRELPIYVSGEKDLIFDQNDFIEFYGEKNYSGKDYRNIPGMFDENKLYMDRYTDTAAYWLSWEGENGKRVLGNVPNTITEDTLKSHIVNIHIEKDERFWISDNHLVKGNLTQWLNPDVFTSVMMNGNNTEISLPFTFQVQNKLENSPVKGYFRLISRTSNTLTNSHKVIGGLNTTEYRDSISFNYLDIVNFVVNASSNDLINGSNKFKLKSLTTTATLNQIFNDWLDIEYYRKNIAINDSLLIVIPDSVSKDLRNINIEGVSSPDNIAIYKVAPFFNKINNFYFNSGVITFSDTISGNDKYLIVKKSFSYSPLFHYKKRFVNLRDNTKSADYIIISNKELLTSSTEYNKFIQEQYNIRTELVYVDDIYDEFSFGNFNAGAIKEFLKNTFSNWQSPKPSYLLLLGDATYDYKKIVPVNNRRKNLVPSYGFPVSDSWYVMFDDSSFIQQMYVGRISASNNEDVLRYLNKHKLYINRKYDDWNKNYFFFSSSKEKDQTQLQEIISANNSIIDNIIVPKPISGNVYHFYQNGSSNYGNYTFEEYQNAINKGSLFVSYIGHSGTQAWDNSILKVEDLQNSYPDRFPLITDFGCSTGRFAESDTDAFGELFVSGSPNGSAIAYLGNASWGFFVTSLEFPRIFYKHFLTDSIRQISLVHSLAKIKLLNNLYNNDVAKVFAYSNIFFGDPIIKIAIPDKPNYFIDNASISSVDNYISELQDSASFSVNVKNYGYATDDSLQIKIRQSFKDSIIYKKDIFISVPQYSSDLIIKLPVHNMEGNHQVTVSLDDSSKITEIYENDNIATYNFKVYSNLIKPLQFDNQYSVVDNSIKFLNPTTSYKNINTYKLEYADNILFNNSTSINGNFDSLYTAITLPGLLNDNRYWWRVKIDDPELNYSRAFSFFNTTSKKYNWFFNDCSYFNESGDVHYDSTNKFWSIKNEPVTLQVISAGFSDGNHGSIRRNNKELITNTFFAGIVAALVDTVDFTISNMQYFTASNSNEANTRNDSLLANYIDNIPAGKKIVITGADSPHYVIGPKSKAALKTIGSKYSDQVGYRTNWCIIGEKGAPIGSVPEAYFAPTEGKAIISISKVVTKDSIQMLLPVINNVSKWNYFKTNIEAPEGSDFSISILDLNTSGNNDTIFRMNSQDSISLTNINTDTTRNIQFLLTLKKNSKGEGPKFYSAAASYYGVPELAVNYQTIKADADSIVIGDSVNIRYTISNLGEDNANNFKASLILKKPDNSIQLIQDTLINLSKDSVISFIKNFKTAFSDGVGNFEFVVEVDKDNKVAELYENNNSASVKFFVKPDTTTSINEASIKVVFNGKDIMDGDYIPKNSKIEIGISYPIWFPLNDTNNVEIFIDDKTFGYHELNPEFDTINRTLKFTVIPQLSDGQHNIRLYLKNKYGKIESSAIYQKMFNVSFILKLFNVYNYPNPFKDKTSFTFSATDIPDEAEIKIYTVAGRLIKEIKYPVSYLKGGFNVLPEWDGKDQDGNEISNGIYLYKVTIKKDNMAQYTMQKLAKVK